MGELMTGSISYMGTKREFAGDVAEVIASAKPGMLLDAFAGMGAIAEAVSERRSVWTNDVQRFAHLVGACRFTGIADPPSDVFLAQVLELDFAAHLERLGAAHGIAIALSDQAMRASELEAMVALLSQAAEQVIERSNYNCFLRLYRDGYFGARQAAEIDALRFAMDSAVAKGTLTENQSQWALMALGRACLKVANTPGHFAQFLRPNAKNFRRVKSQALKSVWTEWQRSLALLTPVGTSEWRAANKATCADSLLLLSSQCEVGEVSVVYCDPPYTDDQYSRYYHVWETLVAYDDPVITGAGRYRPERFVTPFSLKTKVVAAFEELIRSVSAIGADLVVSYPTNGLLFEVGSDPLDLMRKVFPDAELAVELDHHHSTFGASKGPAKAAVSERVYLARHQLS